MTSEIQAQPKKPRLSLTKPQISTEPGRNLLDLCVEITNDGILSDEEISLLQDLIIKNKTPAIPAFNALFTALENHQDRREIYKVIEAILPTSERKAATSQRVIIESSEKEAIKKQINLEKQQAKDLKKINRPIFTANFMVAGSKFEGRPKNIENFVYIDDDAVLVRDKDNKYSKFAVKILTKNGKDVGFVPEFESDRIAKEIDNDTRYEAFFTKILGYEYPIPVVVAYFYSDMADVKTAKKPSQQSNISSSGIVGSILKLIGSVILVIIGVFKVFLK